jgi:hypothetical protein
MALTRYLSCGAFWAVTAASDLFPLSISFCVKVDCYVGARQKAQNKVKRPRGGVVCHSRASAGQSKQTETVLVLEKGHPERKLDGGDWDQIVKLDVWRTWKEMSNDSITGLDRHPAR